MKREKITASLWIRLAKCYGLVLREVRNGKALAETTLPQFDVLVQLLRRPEGTTMSGLSRALLVTAGNITGIVKRLRSRGLIQARTLPNDRRAKVLRITAAGRRVAKAEIRRHERHLNNVFSAVTTGEQEGLRKSLDSLRTALESRRMDR